MKYCLIAYLIFISIPPSYGIGNYKVGDTLFVWAYNGLTCRTGPGVQSARVTAIPYGAQVIVASKDSGLVYTVKELGGFVMRGIWVKVHYQDTLEGYVFDGYLSTFPAIKKQYQDDWVRPYFESVFGPGKRTRRGNYTDNQDCPWKYDIYIFPNKAIAAQECREGGGIVQTLELPNFSFEEAYLLFFLNPKLHLQKKGVNLNDIPLEIQEQNRKSVRMHYELTDYIFEKKVSSIFIKIWSSC